MPIFKQYEEVLARKKTATRRTRLNVRVGKTYAMVPKMSKPAHWFCETVHMHWDDISRVVRITNPKLYNDPCLRVTRCEITVTAIRHEPLWYITEADAVAEGVSSVDEYAKLWDGINTKSGPLFDYNPMVYVIDFAISDRLHDIYNRWLANPVWQEV